MLMNDYVFEQSIDVLAITETWLSSDENTQTIINELCPEGYAFMHVQRMDRQGGGVGLLNTVVLTRSRDRIWFVTLHLSTWNSSLLRQVLF